MLGDPLGNPVLLAAPWASLKEGRSERGKQQKRQVLTLYHSGVLDIDHDGGALGGFLRVGCDGGQLRFAPADGFAHIHLQTAQQGLVAGVQAAAVLLCQASVLLLVELMRVFEGAHFLCSPNKCSITGRDLIHSTGRKEAGKGREKDTWDGVERGGM